jgi:hypothetical protein
VDAHIFTKQGKKNLNKHCLHDRKLRAAVFWDRKGVLMVEFMQRGTTLTSEVYFKILKINYKAIQKKRCGMLTYGVVLFVTMCICIQLLALEHCWSISTGGCLTILLTALISIRVTTTCLST